MGHRSMKLAERLYNEKDQMAKARSSWESRWNRIARRIFPDMVGLFGQQPLESSAHNRGRARTDDMLDPTAALALERSSAIVEWLVTPRNSKWHKLTASNAELKKIKRVRQWFEDLTDTMFATRYAPNAAYAGNQQAAYKHLMAFGTGPTFIDELKRSHRIRVPGIRYKATHLGETYIALDHQGLPAKVARPYLMSAHQAVLAWGDNLPQAIKRAAETNKDPNQEFEFLHFVEPNPDYDPERIDVNGKPWASYYVTKEEHMTLERGGYRTFPYILPRYSPGPGHAYGTSPAMMALSGVDVLNEQKKTVLRQGHLALAPALLAHDDGVLSLSQRPGAVNYGTMTADGKRLVDVIPTGNIAIGKDLMDDERAAINDFFLITLFQILVETPQMSATEVLERTREKGILLSPAMGRIQDEQLGPQIEREIDIHTAQGRIPEMPPELIEAQGEYTVEYDSPLSRAQKAEEGAGVLRSLEFAERWLQGTQDPAAYDWVDVDEAMPMLMHIHAAPESTIRAREAVEAIREQRAQQQAIQQAIEAAPALAGAAKAAS